MLLGRNIKFRVSIGEACHIFYDQLKNHKLYRYLIFYIRTDNVLDIEKIGTRRCSYDHFLGDLRKCGGGDCRLGIFDMEYAFADSSLENATDNRSRGRLLLVHWCPEGANVTKQTLYKSGLKSMRECLGECMVLIKATCAAEPTLAQAVEECRSLERQRT